MSAPTHVQCSRKCGRAETRERRPKTQDNLVAPLVRKEQSLLNSEIVRSISITTSKNDRPMYAIACKAHPTKVSRSMQFKVVQRPNLKMMSLAVLAIFLLGIVTTSAGDYELIEPKKGQKKPSRMGRLINSITTRRNGKITKGKDIFTSARFIVSLLAIVAFLIVMFGMAPAAGGEFGARSIIHYFVASVMSAIIIYSVVTLAMDYSTRNSDSDSVWKEDSTARKSARKVLFYLVPLLIILLLVICIIVNVASFDIDNEKNLFFKDDFGVGKWFMIFGPMLLLLVPMTGNGIYQVHKWCNRDNEETNVNDFQLKKSLFNTKIYWILFGLLLVVLYGVFGHFGDVDARFLWEDFKDLGSSMIARIAFIFVGMAGLGCTWYIRSGHMKDFELFVEEKQLKQTGEGVVKITKEDWMKHKKTKTTIAKTLYILSIFMMILAVGLLIMSATGNAEISYYGHGSTATTLLTIIPLFLAGCYGLYETKYRMMLAENKQQAILDKEENGETSLKALPCKCGDGKGAVCPTSNCSRTKCEHRPQPEALERRRLLDPVAVPVTLQRMIQMM